MGLGFGYSGGGGGASVMVRNVSVAAGATGRRVNLVRLLGSASTFSLLSGTNANITLDNGTGLALTSGLAAGETQTALMREEVGSGATKRAVEYAVNLTGAPVAPSVPAVTLTAGNGQISVAWTDGSNGGAPITSHRIYLDGVLVASPSSASPYVITGLVNGRSYTVQVSAVNSVNEGALSSVQSVVPTAAGGFAPTTFSIAPTAQWHPNTATITTDSNGRMTSLSDAKGFAALSETSAGIGAFVKTDGLGRKFLCFTGAEGIKSTAALSLNLRNCTVMIIARNHLNGPTNPKWMFAGYNADGSALGNMQAAYFSQASAGRATVIGSSVAAGKQANMIADCHVRAYLWRWGANASAGTANAGLRLAVNGYNDNVALSGTPPTPVPGVEIGRNANFPGTSGSWSRLDAYEIIVWTQALTDAQCDAAIAAAMANYGLNNSINQLVVEGDSRTYGFSYAGGVNGFDSSENPAMLMTAPGSPLAIPDTWMVTNYSTSYSSIPAGTGAGGNNNMTYRRDVTDSWSTKLKTGGRNVILWLNGGNNFKLRPPMSGAETYAAQVAWLNTDTTGVLQRGWESIMMTEMQLPSDLYTPTDDLRALEMNAAQLAADTLSGPGQIYEGKVKVVPIHLIKQAMTDNGPNPSPSGTICGSRGDELNTLFYLINPATGNSDGTHPTRVLNKLLWSGADTPQYGIRAALGL